MPVQISGNSVATEEDLEELESVIDRLGRQIEQIIPVGTRDLAREVESLRGELDVLKAQVGKLQKSLNELEASLGTIADTTERNNTALNNVTEELARGNAWLQQANARLAEQVQVETQRQSEMSETFARQIAQNKSYHVALLLALDEYRSGLASLTQLEQDLTRSIERSLQSVAEAILQTRDLVREEISAMTGTLGERIHQQERRAQQEAAAFERLARVQEQICGHAEDVERASSALAKSGAAAEGYQRDQLALVWKRRAQELNNEAVMLVQRKEHATAVTLLEEAIALDGCDPALYVNLGRACACLGQAAKAEQALQAALAFAPDAPAVHNGLAVLYLEQGRPAAALPHLLHSVEREPNDPNTQMNLGKAYYQLGQVSLAITHWQQAQRIDPMSVANDAEIRLLLGEPALLAAQR